MESGKISHCVPFVNSGIHADTQQDMGN